MRTPTPNAAPVTREQYMLMGPAALIRLAEQQAARIAELEAALAQQVPEPQPAALPADPEYTEDLVTIPRGLIGAACSAIDHKRDAPKLPEKLRRYTVGDLSRQPAQQVPAVPGWQPIETAPIHEQVLLWGAKGARSFIGKWRDYNIYNSPHITHWSPIPAAPLLTPPAPQVRD